MKQNLSYINYNNSSEEDKPTRSVCCIPCSLECKKVNEKVNGRELSSLEENEITEILNLFNNSN